MSEKISCLFSAMMLLFLGSAGTEAQQRSPVSRIGILLLESGPSETQTVKGLRDGLKELGYEEGKNILLEIKDAKGNREAIKQQAVELANKKLDLVFTTGTSGTRAAMAATKKVPIVFRHPLDPVALGFVKSLKRPGGNVTGVAALSLDMSEKRLEILKTIVPKLRRIHIFYDANNKYSQGSFAFVQKVAAKLGLEVTEHQIKSSDELKSSVSSIQIGEGDAFYHVPDDLVESQADFIFDTARQRRLPTMFERTDWASKGSLVAYGPSYYQMGRQAAGLVGKILKGEKPENLPVEKANKFDCFINFRTARAIGLSIPPEVLKKADRVIR